MEALCALIVLLLMAEGMIFLSGCVIAFIMHLSRIVNRGTDFGERTNNLWKYLLFPEYNEGEHMLGFLGVDENINPDMTAAQFLVEAVKTTIGGTLLAILLLVFFIPSCIIHGAWFVYEINKSFLLHSENNAVE